MDQTYKEIEIRKKIKQPYFKNFAFSEIRLDIDDNDGAHGWVSLDSPLCP